MRAAGASILRDASSGLLASAMVQSSLRCAPSPCACSNERTLGVHTVGSWRSCEFIAGAFAEVPGQWRPVRAEGAVELRVRFKVLVDDAQPFTSPLSIRVVHSEHAEPLR
jgi:hypothetical protein